MKKILWGCAFILLFSSQGQCGEHEDTMKRMDEAIVKLKAYKSELEGNYEKVITQQLDYSIQRYYAFSLYDHVMTKKGLIDILRIDEKRAEEIKVEYNILHKKLFQEPSLLEELTAKLFFLYREVEEIEQQANAVLADINMLKESWKVRCQESKKEMVAKFYNPRAHFLPDEPATFVQSPAGSFNFQTSVGMNQGAFEYNFKSTDDKGSLGMSQEDEEAVDGVALGVAGYCGYWYAACVAAYYAIKFIVIAIVDAGKLDESAKKEKEQLELINSIYHFQRQKIDQLQLKTEAMVSSACETHFQNGPVNWSVKYVSDHSQKVGALYKDIGIFIEKDMEDLQKGFYDSIIDTYLPKVITSYYSNMESYFQKKSQVNKLAIEFTKQEVAPILVEIKAEGGAMAKAILQQKIWDKVIRGDAKFLNLKSDTLFRSKEAPAIEFGNRWQSIGPEIIKEAM